VIAVLLQPRSLGVGTKLLVFVKQLFQPYFSHHFVNIKTF